MEKLIFNDNTTIEILEGASLSAITTAVNSWGDLATVADALKKEGNLDTVKFAKGEEVTGSYEHMRLETPLFKAVDVVGDKVLATFAIREKTELEREVDALKRGQDVQDEAIIELAGMMGGE